MASPRARLVLSIAVALALVPAAEAIAKPPPRETATPDQLRAYVSSGQYLMDVEAAVAPARAFLVGRMDEIDQQRAACTAAGSTRSAASSPRAAPRATAELGRTTITLRRAVLRRAGARLVAVGASVSGGRRVVTTVRGATITDTTGRLTQAGAITLRRGARTVVLRGLEVRLARGRVSVSARVGGERVTVLQSVASPRRPALTKATQAASVVAAPVRLTRAGARALRPIGLPAGRIGIVTVDVPGVAAAPPAFVPTAASCRAVPAKPAMVLDIDETALSAYLAGGDPGGGMAGQAPELLGTAVALPPVLELFRYARSRGVAVDFVTARILPQSLNTGANLDSAGYADRIGVTYRTTTQEDPGQYKRDARQALQEQMGYTIIANVGDQCSDLYAGQAERSFKLPNTFYLTAGKMDATCDPNG